MIPTKEQCDHWNKGCDIGQEIESWKKFVREVDKEWLDGKMPLVERADCLRYADAALLALRVNDACVLSSLVIKLCFQLLSVRHFLVVSNGYVRRASCLADVFSILILFVATSRQGVDKVSRLVA